MRRFAHTEHERRPWPARLTRTQAPRSTGAGLASVVRASLADLPDAERRVLVLAYDEDLSQSQIAARLGLPIGTVKSRTRRAMAMLRARLTEIPELMN